MSKVNASLFHWYTRVSEAEQLAISEWHASLTDDQRDYIDTLREEAIIRAAAEQSEREWS